jgi:acyl-coenzyme A synthetase/AMP-(fatty) acid ligase
VAHAIWSQRPDTVVILAGDDVPATAGVHSREDLINDGDVKLTPTRPGPRDVAAIFFTSGTTGRPKGPLGIHGPLAEVWHGLGAALGCGPNDVHLAQLPLAFGFGMQMAAIALFTGGCLRLMPRFSVSETLEVIERDGVTILNGTPAHFNLLLKHPASKTHDCSTLRTGVGSAASFPPALLRRVLDELKMQLLLLYGSSELLYVCTSDRDDLLRGAVGRPTPGQLMVVAPDHTPCPIGELGEIAFRVRWPVRYWKEPDAGRNQGDWYYTGDVGSLDDDGRLYVLGRVKHQINRGGHKIDPGEVEALVHSYPGIIDHAVIGIPDPILGQTVCLCVVARGDPPGLDELRAHLARSLASYKLPETLCPVPAIPRNHNGKVDHDALQTMAGSFKRVNRTRT